MATTRIRAIDQHPTTAAIALDLRDGGGLPGVTRAEVVAAARVRGVPIHESRIPRSRVADIYFAIARERGVLD